MTDLLSLPTKLAARLAEIRRSRRTGNLTVHFRGGEEMAVRFEEVESLTESDRKVRVPMQVGT